MVTDEDSEITAIQSESDDRATFILMLSMISGGILVPVTLSFAPPLAAIIVPQLIASIGATAGVMNEAERKEDRMLEHRFDKLRATQFDTDPFVSLRPIQILIKELQRFGLEYSQFGTQNKVSLA